MLPLPPAREQPASSGQAAAQAKPAPASSGQVDEFTSGEQTGNDHHHDQEQRSHSRGRRCPDEQPGEPGEGGSSQLELEHAEREDELTPLPAANGCASAGEDTQPAGLVNTNLVATQTADEGALLSAVQESSRLQEEAAAVEEQADTTRREEEHERRQFNRLDPSRRSFSSPGVNLLLQPTAAAQTCSPKTTIFARLTKTIHTDRQQQQQQRNNLCGEQPKNSPTTEKLRRRTALGLIPLQVRQPQSAAAPAHQSNTITSSWRSWLFSQQQAPSSSSKTKFSLRQLSANNPAPSKQVAGASRSMSAATGYQEQQQLQRQQGQPSEHVDNGSPSADNRVAPPTGLAADDGARGERAKAKAGRQKGTQSAGCLSMKSIKGELTRNTKPQQTDSSNSNSNSNSNSKATDESEQEQQQHEQQASNSNTKMMSRAADQSLVDRLIDSQLDWRHLVREANGELGLSRLSEPQIKRQEVIHELVQTERHHCLTLALMRQVYLAGLRRLNESRASPLANLKSPASSLGEPHAGANQQQQQPQPQSDQLIDLERLFPALEDLIQAHELFFAHLRLRLLDSCTPSSSRPFLGYVGALGDLLCDQFRLRPPAQGAQQQQQQQQQSTPNSADLKPSTQQQQQTTNGQKLLQAYGKFCGSHSDSSKYYKQLMHNDKGFRQFIESCQKQNPACRQRGIPECNLLVAQRLTKYPLLLEQLIKTSKDEPGQEQERLGDALRECKLLLAELNQQLARKESFERLLDIYAHFSPKSFTIYNRHLKFTKHDLLQHKRVRQLIHCDGQVRIWSATRRKLFQVLCLILNDIIVFLRFEPAAGWDLDLAGGPGSGPALGGDPLCAVPSSSSAAASSFAHQHQQQQQQLQSSLISQPVSQVSQAAHLQQQQQPEQQQPLIPSFRYYFANLDNKSSVISLSKLLVREKAAHEQEPRVYLISSNPRQPEMYELAFVSKRHQVGFVDKLKGCIEQHQRRVASLEESEFGAGLEFDNQNLLMRLSSTAASGLSGDDDDDEADDDELVELNLEDCDCCAICREELELSAEEDEEEAEDGLQLAYAAARRGSPSRTNCRSTTSKSLRQKKQQEQQRRRADTLDANCLRLDRGGGGQLDIDCELDIERDVVSPPPSSSASSSCSLGASSADERAAGADLASFVCGASGSEPTGDQEQKHSPAEAREAATKLEPSSESCTAADSGLSERAKDSLDEAAPSKQKLRGANRRRRAQRPRNVSNQSSSSSEAAHRQAIELISQQISKQLPAARCSREEDEFDSGRGHDDSCCSSSSSSSSSSSAGSSSSSGSNSLDSLQRTRSRSQPSLKAAAAAAKGAPVPLVGQQPGGSPRAVASESGATQQVAPLADELRPPALVSAAGECASNPTSSSCGSSTVGDSNRASSLEAAAKAPAPIDRRRLETPKAAAAAAAAINCSSIIAAEAKKSCRCCCSKPSSKQRKLSNVSSLSGQLKLISRLKSGFELSGAGASLARRASGASKCSSCHHLAGPMQHTCDKSAAASAVAATAATTMATLNKQMRQQMRRSSFVPEQKLEELRDLRIQLDKDKQEWQAKFDRMQEQLLDERRELDLAREQLKRDRQQVASEREQLYRKLDALKEKGILLSPSHRVIITAPEQAASLQTGSTGAGALLSYGQPQRQQPGQAAHRLIAANSNNSIRIHRQPATETMPARSSFVVATPTNNHYPMTATATATATTNLFIQSSRVPLHLSENSPVAPASGAHCKQTALAKVTTPLISAIGNNLFGGGERLTATGGHHQRPAGSSLSAGQHLESHVI